MTPQDDNALDRVIDEVAAGMTAGGPDTAFRARVIARLEECRAWWRSPWAWTPAAAAAIVLVAVAMGVNRSGRAVPESTERAALPSRIIATLATIPSPQPGGAIAASPVGNAMAPRRTAAASAVAALAPSPLEVPSLAITAMTAGDSIQIPELETIAPITVPPIGETQGERR